MKLPLHRIQEDEFVLVDLRGGKARDLAPCSSGIVSILEIFGCKDEGGQEHASPALDGVRESSNLLLERRIVLLLLLLLENAGFDSDQVVERHLKGTVAGARTAKRFLDEGA